MNGSDKQIYRFDDFEVDLSRSCLLRGGEEKHLRQKAFLVLVYLITRSERLVSKDELFQNVWAGTAVTDDVLVQCVTEIRRAIGDNAHRPRFIRTVPKAGYRFIGPVDTIPDGLFTEEITRVEVEFEEEFDSPLDVRPSAAALLPAATWGYRSYARYAAASLAIVLAAASIGYFTFTSSSQTDVRLPQIEGRKAVAVMFFENQSQVKDLDWLREGLADMLITDLSRSKNLTVLSRQQLHVLLERDGYRAQQRLPLEAALDIAGKSQADIMLTGSFASLGKEVRIDGQLHDAKTGQLLAAERIIAEDPGQVLNQVGLLSIKLAAHLDGGIRGSQTPALEQAMTDNLEAYRYYSLAVEKAQALHNEEAIELLEKAVALDPEFAMAHGRIGYAYAVTGPYAEKAKPYLEKAFQLSDRLTEKDRLYIMAWYSIAHQDYPSAIVPLRRIITQYPLEAEPYFRLAYLLRGENQHEEAIKVLKQGLAVDAEAKDIYNALGLIYLDLHRHDDAIEAHRRYVQLAPAEANAHDSLGMSYQCAGRYDEAIATYKHALDLNPRFGIAVYHLGHTYAQLGRYADAIGQYRQGFDVAGDDRGRAVALGAIAEVYWRKDDIDRAAATAREELSQFKYAVWNSLVIALHRGDRQSAERLEAQLFAPAPFAHRGQAMPPRYLYHRRGYLALRAGRGPEAIALFRSAVENPPLTWTLDPLEDCLANAYLELGMFDEAIAEYERILQINPNYPLAHFHLGEAYRKKGMAEQAHASYLTFLDVWKNADPDIPQVIAAKNFMGAAL
ncbi:MAG TPA: tetratricopeptide repeat protein [Pyrinomonadaceae bacterium]|nr:tetratricopeptide repeat protein [Pyrinomonadaceae bacterium]